MVSDVLPDYASAVRAVRDRMTAGAADHCERVAETSAHLAGVYGVDVQRARIAGLLHDWSRELDDGALLDAAERHGIEITEVDRAVPYLLHAEVSAAEVRVAYPELDGDIVGAVAGHTYGRTGMGALEMVVYVADTLEPARNHAGVQELRAAVGEVELQELFARTYAASMVHVIQSRRPVHPSTVRVWNAIVAGTRP